MKISFVTPTQLSLLDVTTMGNSSKRGDEKTIGCFDSGLKYAIALLLRAEVSIEISVYGRTEDRGDWEENMVDIFTFDTVVDTCETTSKEKELIRVQVQEMCAGATPQSQHKMCEPTASCPPYYVQTGFALQLGHNWELWMALRELWSNMLDENGHIYEGETDVDFGTVVTLNFDKGSEFEKIWNERNLYINEKPPLYEISSTVDVLENKEGFLRIYKQNILVYTNKETPSKYAYNIKFGTIDERRVLSNVYGVGTNIVEYIMSTKNEEFLREIITGSSELNPKDFLSDRNIYGTANNLIHKIACEVYQEFGEVHSFSWLIDAVKKRKDCGIAGKKITSVEDSLWTYSGTVEVTTEPTIYSTPDIVETEEGSYEDMFASEIRKKYNFNLDVEVKKSRLKGSKVIADKFQKCLIVDEDFNLEDDFPEFIVQYIDLTVEGNVIKNMSEYIVKLLKK